MYSLGKRVLAWSAAVSLAAAPALTASKPLGLVLRADKARLTSAPAQSGTNVYAGDSASTEKNGALLMQLGNAQVQMGSESQARFDASEGRVTAALSHGTLSFAVEGEESMLVYAAGAWIRAQGTGRTNGEISILGANELLVTSRGGALEVIVDNETTVVPQNQSARLGLEPERHEVEGAGKNTGRKRRIAAYTLTAAGVAAIVTCAVLFNTGNSASPVQVSGHCN